MVALAPRTVQCMPDSLRHWPKVVLQPASTTRPSPRTSPVCGIGHNASFRHGRGNTPSPLALPPASGSPYVFPSPLDRDKPVGTVKTAWRNTLCGRVLLPDLSTTPHLLHEGE